MPAALAAPVAEQSGWRFSLGLWSVTSVVALVPSGDHFAEVLRGDRASKGTERSATV
jgi:hypothetical protein